MSSNTGFPQESGGDSRQQDQSNNPFSSYNFDETDAELQGLQNNFNADDVDLPFLFWDMEDNNGGADTNDIAPDPTSTANSGADQQHQVQQPTQQQQQQQPYLANNTQDLAPAPNNSSSESQAQAHAQTQMQTPLSINFPTLSNQSNFDFSTTGFLADLAQQIATNGNSLKTGTAQRSSGDSSSGISHAQQNTQVSVAAGLNMNAPSPAAQSVQESSQPARAVQNSIVPGPNASFPNGSIGLFPQNYLMTAAAWNAARQQMQQQAAQKHPGSSANVPQHQIQQQQQPMSAVNMPHNSTGNGSANNVSQLAGSRSNSSKSQNSLQNIQPQAQQPQQNAIIYALPSHNGMANLTPQNLLGLQGTIQLDQQQQHQQGFQQFQHQAQIGGINLHQQAQQQQQNAQPQPIDLFSMGNLVIQPERQTNMMPSQQQQLQQQHQVQQYQATQHQQQQVALPQHQHNSNVASPATNIGAMNLAIYPNAMQGQQAQQPQVLAHQSGVARQFSLASTSQAQSKDQQNIHELNQSRQSSSGRKRQLNSLEKNGTDPQHISNFMSGAPQPPTPPVSNTKSAVGNTKSNVVSCSDTDGEQSLSVKKNPSLTSIAAISGSLTKKPRKPPLGIMRSGTTSLKGRRGKVATKHTQPDSGALMKQPLGQGANAAPFENRDNVPQVVISGPVATSDGTLPSPQDNLAICKNTGNNDSLHSANASLDGSEAHQNDVEEEMTEEERALANRLRNREHARNTRLRKKAYLEQLKSTLDELCRERDALVTERAGAATLLLEMQKTRTDVLLSFFALRSKYDKRRNVWSSILDESVTCVMPVTPYRSFPASEVQVSKCQRTIMGVDAMIADAASIHVLFNSIVDRSKFPEGNVQFRYTLIAEEAVVSGNQMMARWGMTSVNLKALGARAEVGKVGMLCARFNSAHKIVALEIMFDVMAFMLQLKQSAGSNAFAVVPNTVQTCQGPQGRMPKVMTLAERPYTIVQVNRQWEEMTGWTADEVVGKASCQILQGQQTSKHEIQELMSSVRLKRPAYSVLTNYVKETGKVFRNFLAVYPLSTDSKISHYVGFTVHIEWIDNKKVKIEQSQQVKIEENTLTPSSKGETEGKKQSSSLIADSSSPAASK
eukprot:CAMPEP_0184856860 /NCGR_PEP_ID=MMETSP0580-20130426/2037_1 /TAXON_ID=1118495 /ORGANISM="Dactyliosolen fragilissimus" /LENGTH=1118 /DNA_ID=CAMNT_0027352121 /DNA_START=102 /DNA_END=3458 /DNA_ORIENTATION=+